MVDFLRELAEKRGKKRREEQEKADRASAERRQATADTEAERQRQRPRETPEGSGGYGGRGDARRKQEIERQTGEAGLTPAALRNGSAARRKRLEGVKI